MIKTLKLREGVEITLANDTTWLEHFKAQFGRDMLPVIMPLLLGIGNSISALAEEAGDIDKIDQNAILRVLGSDSLIDIALRFASFESTDIMHMTWAMAKAYDENIKDPIAWQKELAGIDHESLPVLDVIAPAIFELVTKGMMSSNFWERLTKNAKKLKNSVQPKKTKKK